MTTYEQQVIDGVPCLVNGINVFYYDPTGLPWSADPKEPIRLGALVEGRLRLDESIQERIQPRIDAWRSSLGPVGRNEVVRAPKQSKPKRSPKSAGTATNTNTNTIVEPEPVTVAEPKPAPTRVLKRRKAVPTTATGSS
jgi:hypothetical protein